METAIRREHSGQKYRHKGRYGMLMKMMKMRGQSEN